MSGMGRDKILGRIERETGLRIWPRSSPNAWNLPIFTHSFSRCTAVVPRSRVIYSSASL
jgi:hypothetical protein